MNSILINKIVKDIIEVANECDNINMPLKADSLTRIAYKLTQQELELKELYSDALKSILNTYRISEERFSKYPDIIKDVIYSKAQEEVTEIMSEPWREKNSDFIS